MSETALDRISRLSPAKQKLLQQKLRQTAAAQGPPPIGPSPWRGTTDRFPCSFAQQRLWVLHQLDPESAVYNVPCHLQMAGPLCPAALAATLDAVIRRHEPLRTWFEPGEDGPVQVVGPPEPVPLPAIDLSELPAALRAAEAGRLVREETARPFDLRRAPLLRAGLVVLEPERHLVLLTLHHIVSDAWSIEVLTGELAALYEALSHRGPSPLPELDVQYADFAHWQRSWLAGEVLAAELDHWRTRLDGLEPLLDLPADRPRPAVLSGRGGSRFLALPPGLADSFQAISRSADATLFMSLATAFQALLARYTGREDLAVGTPVAGRNDLRTERMIGFFINMLVLRNDLSGEPSFRELVGRMRQVALTAFAHQDLPFEKLVAELRSERDLSYHPVFQVAFSLQAETGLAPARRPSGLGISRIGGGGGALFDLTLDMARENGRLMGALTYASDLFDAATAGRMVEHLSALLAGVAAAPELPVAAVPLLSPAERHQLLHEWGEAVEHPAPWRSVPALFRERARLAPDAVALLCGGLAVSYGGLRRRAERLACTLRALGVGPEVPVALCLERSADSVAAALAVLMAGGAFVPLDPEWPAERMAALLQEIGEPVVVADAPGAQRLPPWDGAVVSPADGADGEGPPLPEAAPQSLAYMIYTSGTTGRPKAVMVEHGSLAQTLAAACRAWGFGPGDTLLSLASTTFDISLFELLAPLLAGATVEVLTREERLDPEALAGALSRATLFHAVPSLMRQVAGLPGRGAGFTALRRVFVGGDAVTPDLLRETAAVFPRARLEILYGPTEATIVCAGLPVPAGDRKWQEWRNLIGRPFAGVALRVLDRLGSPVPAGVPGELWIAGGRVTRGYFRRPELTAERYVPLDGRRFYRTGDRARWLADGRLEFLGRLDGQVKVRGIRVELGEVEAALSALPEVRGAAVLARRDTQGERRLVAYVAGPDVPPAGELRRLLQERLPGYLVPAAFVPLAALPLTPHGKVDRRALERLDPASPEPSAPVPPRRPAEEVLAAIWAQVLGVESVGVEDDFFSLGGDSILAIQVIARASQAGLRLTPRQIFEHPTVAGLAAVAVAMPARAADEGPLTGEVPLTPVQHELFAQLPLHPHHFNQTVWLEFAPPPGEPARPDLLERALAAVVAHHDALRLRFEPPAGGREGWRQRVDPPAPGAPFTRIDVSALPRERREAGLTALAASLQGSLDLERGPLLRAALCATGSAERLLLVIHHLAVDGVSWRILLEDLETAYRQLAAGEAPALPPRTASLRSWAEHLTGYARSAAARVEYWLERRHVAREPLPADFAAGASENTLGSSRAVVVALDRRETQALLRDVPGAYRTRIDDVLLTALAEACAAWTGRGGLWVELEGHGREDLGDGPDVSRTVGWFTSLYPVLLDTAGAAGPGEALKAVKEQLRAVPGRGVPFGAVLHLGDGEAAAALRTLPAPRISFNYLGQLDQVVAAGRLFRGSGAATGPARHPAQIRRHDLEVGGSVTGERLQMAWIFSEALHRRSTIEDLAGRFLTALRRLVAHCAEVVARGEQGHTPSDFPLAGLGQRALDRVTAEVGRGIEDLYPASPMQSGMLFHTLQAPGSGVYVEQLALVLGGGFDLAAFQAAWRKVVERHPVLRTTFYERDLETPLQVVHREVSLSWESLDWRDLPRAAERRRIEAWLQEDRRRGFDPAEPPLLRFAFARLGGERHLFVWSHHHILLDGWSLTILLRELFAVYAAERRGEEPRLGPVRPFRDYVAWLVAQDFAESEAFWRRELAGFAVPVPLPLDRPARADVPSRRASAGARVAEAATEALRLLARREGLTPNTLVQAAWALLLDRWGGAGDVIFGVVNAGRSAPIPHIEDMVGLFLNTLPARVRLAPRQRLGPWLREIQERQVEARQHEHTPLATVLGWSDVPRAQALFDSIIAFENYPMDQAAREEAGRGLQVTDVVTAEQTNYALALMAAQGSRLELQVLYDGSRFDATTVQRLLGHLDRALTGMAWGFDRAAEDLPLLTEAERQQLLEWNATGTELSVELTLAALFEARADLAPELPAVLGADGESLSYGEVEARANRLANLLRRLGARPGELVAVQLDRSPAMVEALLGIAKSGAAYLPLETTWPEARIRWILDRMGVRAMVLGSATLEPVAGLAPELPTLRHLVCLEPAAVPGASLPKTVRLWGPADVAASPASRPPGLAGPDDLAYVIFTSGSTGAPKGVMVRHRPAANLIDWVNRTHGVGPGDRLLFVTSLCFDLSVYDVFGVLAAGGAVRVASRWEMEEPRALAGVLATGRITFWDSAPAALQQLVPFLPAAVAGGGGDDLRLVFLSGDWVPLPLPGQIRASFPGARVVALGGATEATVWSNFFPVEEVAPEWRSVPYGRPIQNARYYVLDGRLDPCPAGVPGDLYIGGGCLSSGYAAAPELTADRYLPDPFAAGPDAVMYRTGDRARFFADGNLEFLGRLDHQVKIRGFRIELGEIEAALARHPGVREAVALAREDRSDKGPEDRRLVAYVIAAGAAPAPGELRTHLEERLPEYMVPSAFVFLDAWPVTPNGKLDRRALPAPEMASGEPSPASGDPFEEVLAAIFCELLQVGQVGPGDNFFALGGHSLLAIQLVSRVRESFGVELSLRTIFDAGSLADLAASLREELRAGGEALRPPVEPAPRDRPLPPSFAQRRMWFLDQLGPMAGVYHIPLAFRVRGALRPEALAAALTEVVRRHEALRTTFQTLDGELVQVISPAAAFPLPVVDLAAQPEPARRNELRRLAREAEARRFDLERGPLLRAVLVVLGEEEHALLLTLHHVVGDGWSMGRLVQELGILYGATVAGRPSPLPELRLQYPDFAVWQRLWLSGEGLDRELAHWRAQLGPDAGEPIPLPFDRPRPAVPTASGGSAVFAIPAQRTEAAQAFSRARSGTLFMTVLAAFQALLARCCGTPAISVGTPVAGRGLLWTEDLIGLFVNTLVLRSELGGDPSFVEALARVREVTLQAFAHQDLPFELLVEELQPDRSLSHLPLFQVMFTLDSSPLSVPDLASLALEPLTGHREQTQQFELSLNLTLAGGRILGALDYRRDLFDAPTVQRMRRHFATLLDAAVAEPERPLSSFTVLDPGERHQLLAEWNDSVSAFPRDAGLPELFAEVARERPEAPALVTPEGEVWSYRRLAEASSRLARHLSTLGVGPEVAVGICMERSAELILGILAILEAGGAYLPLDAGYPDERLAFMLEEAEARVVLVHAATRERMDLIRNEALLLVDAEPWTQAAPLQEARERGPEVEGRNLALVIFTSGSTGRPKGVALPHRGVVRLVRDTNYLGVGAGDRVAHGSNISFDAATLEIWGALLNGAALVLIPGETMLSPARLASHLRRHEVTVLFLTTALFNQMAHQEPGAFAGLRTVMFGGEAADRAAVARALDEGGPERLLHLYGPAESTTLATWHCVREVPPGAVTVPIGLPVANSSVYVLDRRQHPVPLGVGGELCVGGDGLARGYLNRPELTAERFIPHPWAAGERLYRTGDLVFRLPDGRLDFLGRVDQQVKIRGFRVEPGEIEARLAAVAGVRQAVVAARESLPGGRALVAWVVPGEGAALTASEMRRLLGDVLPDYMVPAHFVFLPALPLTPNGKVDRRALPAPEVAAAGGSAAPRTPLEEMLAGIFAELLGRESVGADEGFFDLGGHSLLATRVVSRVRQTCGVELPLQALFESPTPAGLAAAVEQALREREGQEMPPLERAPRHEPLPLSFAQERLWFLDRLEPGNTAYSNAIAVRAEGSLDPAALAASVRELARRHEPLRTAFGALEGRPVQVIAAPEAAAPLPVIDLRGLPAAPRRGEARRLVRAEGERPFDLSRAPLARWLLVRSGERESLIVLAMHHIISDGWSMSVLVREMQALYDAFSHGRPSPLAELPLQYADFAVWQRRWLSGEVLAAELESWRRRLAGAPALLELPTDRPRPPVRSYHGAGVPVLLSREAEALRRLAREEGATLFMVLMAGFQVLLGRYSGQPDVCVGTPIAGRRLLETEGLIGFFVNMLVLRADLSGAPSFREAVGRVRDAALSAYAHQDLPFEKLVEKLQPQRDMVHSPLYQAAFTFQNAPAVSLEAPALRFSSVDSELRTVQVDLHLILGEAPGVLAGRLQYATALFDATTALRISAHLRALLAAAAAGPGGSVADLPLWTEAERHQLLLEWGGIREELAATSTLHSRFAARARQAPDAAALTCDEVTLSYGELHRRSNRLAHWLRRQGAGPESRVGLCLDRSVDLVVGLLGVLKAGAAYVPLDPDSPRERLAFVLEDAGIRIVVGAEEFGQLERFPADDLEPLADEPSLAYVIYTSGSTGRPKGALITHANIARLFDATEAWFGFGERDVWTLFHSYTFDFSVWEIWGALLYGGRLVIVPWEVSRSPELFLDLLGRVRVTVLNQTPSAFVQLVQVEAQRGAVETALRLVIFGGEALDPASLEPWFERHGDTEPRLVNMYGITETTVHVTYRPLSTADARGEHRSVIGVPIADLSLAVLDRSLRPVPIGVPGELVVGGAGLARGYLGRPELTAERFVPDPASGRPGARLYRSGDLGRFLPNGDVEYLGRLDHQVKIRGFRIELGEIEAALAALPGVHQAVGMVREDRSGDRRLVAYVVGDVAVAELRRSLRERLPDYMVPAAFVTLAALPLTVNGKVDRKALPAPEQPGGEEEYLAPRTPAEEVLAGIWADLLGLERVGAADHFFELGGHSLLATRLVSAMRDLFGVEVPVRAVFEAPTVAALARHVAGLRPGDAAPPLVRVPRTGELPLSFAQQRLWFLDRLVPGNAFYNIFNAVPLAGSLDVAALERAFHEIVRRHEVLRTSFPAVGGRPVQAIAPASSVALPVVDLGGLPEAARRTELDRLSWEESRRPFDLGRGPLLRLSLVRGRESGWALLVSLHHIVADGWSSAILLHELSVLYDAFTRGLDSPLPELPIQYADFAVWQRGWLQGEVLERQMAYWREQLAGAPRVLELAHDRPRPAVETFRGSHEPLSLPPSLGRGIQSLSRQSGATPFMAVLAGFSILLGRYSGQTDVPVGTGIANRNRREVEGLIGFFVNTLVLRMRLDGRASFREILTRAREVALGAYEHEDLPFEMLVDELQPERDASHHPLAQAMLIFQNFQRPALRSRDGEVAPPQGPARDSGTAKVDLALFVSGEGEAMQGMLEYNSDLFETATVRRLLGHFVHLLEAAVADPEAALADLPLLSEPQRHQLVREWSRGMHRADPPDLPVHRRFQLHAGSAPSAPALASGEETLTYAQLAARVDRLARHLRSLGVGPEVRVGVALERSPEAVVAVMAIWRAGGVYVPLDPSYPRARLSFMAEDAGLSLLLTQSAVRDLVPLDPGMPVVLLDRLPQGLAAWELDGLGEQVDPDNLAYVIYTSGSTGRSKGVGLTHRGLSNLSNQFKRSFELGPGSRFLQFASLGFDGSVFEIAMALSTGACLCVAPRSVLLPGPGLVDLLRRRRVTHLILPPSALAALGEVELPDLVNLVVAGEAPTAELVERWAAGRRFFNGYGPTENTVCTTLERCRPGSGKPAIGRPIDNVRVYVLDGSLRPVPPGVAAELCAGGDGLARGYLGRPDLTAERFVPDPFSTAPGGRLYRTGDLVRHLPSGACDFLGRTDQQVKVRGFRIELGEIESTLQSHAAIRDCAVAVHEDGEDSDRLVAYFVQGSGPVDGERDDLQEQQVSQWKLVFNQVYGEEPAAADPSFNITGWNSSYTGLPLAAEEMREWLGDTVERILSLRPRRVLEIGCGSGLVLFRVAPHCEAYWGTDISSHGLAYVEEQLGRMPDLAARVRLSQRPADRFEGLEEGSFDLVVLNSVAQYFPSADYLAAVLQGAVKAVRPGGAVFLGDLRSLPLLAAFHASLELERAEPRLPLHRVRGRLRSRRLEEEELVIAPAFFAALQLRLPEIGRVEVHPKRGRFHNELMGFRYTAVLRIGESPAVPPPRRLDWQREGLSLESLRGWLAAETPEVVALCNVPNARVTAAAEAARWIADGEENEDAGELRERISRAAAGVEPQDLWDLGRELPYDVELGWASHGGDGSLEAALVRRDVGIPPAALLSAPALSGGDPSPRQAANDPLQGRAARRLVPELRAFLAERLPEYMVPAAFVPLDVLPLTPNGKVDRRALSAPDQVLSAAVRFVAPRTPTEELLADVYSELLRVERVGIESSFFELGGHSLLATQLVSRVSNAFGVELQVRSVFESPTVAGLAAAVDDARHHRRGRRPPIEPVPHDRPLPLSFSQQRLWFLDQLEPGGTAYNMPMAVHLEAGLDAGALAHALGEAVRRHAVLRTTFGWEGEEPVQRIAPPGPFLLPLVDLAGLPERDREREIGRLTRREAMRRFDLGRGPMLRSVLLALGAESHLLLLTMHHIASDGWSMGVLLREIEAAYAAFREGRPSPLPELPIQYADYAVWQRRWLTGEALAGDLEFWRGRLRGVATLDLPTDRPRPPVQSFAGASRVFSLGETLADRLQALSRSRGATMFMTLLAALQTLLARSTGQTDVSVGTPIAGRNQTQTEGLVGFFVNTLVLRTDLSGDPSFLDLLGRVREVTLDAYAHQDLPFERLVEDLKPERDLARTPLFQVMVGLQTATDDRPGAAALRMRTGSGGNEPAQFDLTLSLNAGPRWVRGFLNHATALFDGTTAERLLAHLRSLLAAAVASPQARLSELPLLGEAERHALLVEWSDTAMAGAADGTVHGLVERQAAWTPDAVALVCGDHVLTYGALERRANQLAWRLRRLAVGPEVRVAVLLERSPEMVVALLGVLKAGGAYVPLDPAYPAERLALMAEDSQAAVLLTQESLDEALPPAGATVLRLDAGRAALAGESGDAPPPLAGPENLAYVLFTSGSTGRPKGVQIPHGAVVSFLRSMACRPGLDSGDVLVAITTLSFDIAGLEIFLPLAQGAVVVLADRETAADPVHLAALLDQAQATVLQATPATWQLLLGGGWAGSRHLAALCGGEAMPPSLAAELQGRVRELWNVYGPTETTIWSTLTPVRDAPRTIPVGRPIANTRVQVLDGAWQPVALGSAGELCIGGAGLARGYLERPDLTAERFVPDPAGDEPGGRLYRTGDLARWLVDGTLEVLGRIDRQVKIRGYRIEPGEVEAALASHPAVRQAAVVARADRAGGRTLVAYLVAGESPDPAGLREHLRRRLPDYMVPSLFVPLDALPLTPSGKVDRRALPAPEAAAPGGSRSRPPRNGTELELLRIWEGLLPVRPIGVRDDFFDLGGHSLLAARLMAQIQKQLGRALPLAELFRGATIEHLATVLEQGAEPLPHSCLLPLSRLGDLAPFFCVHPASGGALVFQPLARHLAPDRPVYGIQALGRDPGQKPLSRIEEMAHLYVRAVRSVQPEGPYHLGGWSFGGLVAYEMARLLAADGAEVAALILLDTVVPGDMAPEEPPAEGSEADELAGLLAFFGAEAGLPVRREELAGLGSQEQMRHVAGLVVRSGFLAERDLDLAMNYIERFVAVCQAGSRAADSYRPSPYPGRVTVVRAARPEEPELDSPLLDPLNGWGNLAAEVEVHEVAASHQKMMTEPHVAEVANVVRRRLARLQGEAQ